MLQVIREFKKLIDGQNPDLLVFASNFWDIATYTTKNASKLVPEDLEEYVLEEFQDNFSSVLSTIEVGICITSAQCSQVQTTKTCFVLLPMVLQVLQLC